MSASNHPESNLEELKTQFQRHMLDCAYLRKRYENKIASTSNLKAHISIYQEIIPHIEAQILINKKQLQEIDAYKEDGEQLKQRMMSELNRQYQRIEDYQQKISQAQSLQFLCSLAPAQLLAEAKKNKSSVVLILQTPQLIARIPELEFAQITHQDSDISKKFASVLASREYTPTIAKTYAALKQQVHTHADHNFIINEENKAVHRLLLKMRHYLDKKIEQALHQSTPSWSLGYFGSRYHWQQDNKKTAIPQGIHKLKSSLELLDQNSAIEKLDQIQLILQTKLEEIHDNSFFNAMKRFISYLFGYARSQATIADYEHLNQMSIGNSTVSA